MNLQRIAMKAAAAATPFLFALGAANSALSAEPRQWEVSVDKMGPHTVFCAERDLNNDGLWDKRYCKMSDETTAKSFYETPSQAAFSFKNAHKAGHETNRIHRAGKRDLRVDLYWVIGPEQEKVYQERTINVAEPHNEEPDTSKLPMS